MTSVKFLLEACFTLAERFVFAATFLTFGCAPVGMGPDANDVASVELTIVDSPTDTITSLGGELRIRALARARDGRIAKGATVIWDAASPEILGIVASDSTSVRVRAMQNGISTIQAQAKTKDQSTWITAARALVVRQAPAKLVIVQQGYSIHSNIPDMIGVFNDAPLQVEARPVDALGSYVSGAISALFSVDDSTIVRTSPSGQVLGLRDGTTTLRARATQDGRVLTGSVYVGLRRPL